eukprot:3434951-Karenia_brevis.AAC.1
MLAEFLRVESHRGPTVSASRYYAFTKLNKIFGLQLPLASSMLDPYRRPPVSEPRQQTPAPFALLAHLEVLLQHKN